MPITYFERFIEIIKKLRSPEGCPWDREQTVESLRGSLLEEAYECVDAINSGDDDHINEEVGDLFLLAAMISYMKEQQGVFTVESVINNISEKLVRRHPHVFADVVIEDSKKVLEQWDRIKRDVEGKVDKESILNTVPKSLPPLERAYRYQKKAAKVGFDWKRREHVWEKIHEEIDEINKLGKMPTAEKIEDELGDLLFSVVNLCRHYDVDPAIALHRTNTKFLHRFNFVEKAMAEQGRALCEEELERMDELWEQSKSLEK